MRHKKIYSIILLFLCINCVKYTTLCFSSLFEKPWHKCDCNDIVRRGFVGEDYKKKYANIFAGMGCMIDNPIAYYLRILVDIVAWYFRFSKVKNESRYYKTYYGTELGVAFYPLHRYRVTSFCLELNFNLLSWLLYFPCVFIACPDIIGRLIHLFFAAIFVHSSIFICNFSLLKEHLEIHAVNILQILCCLFIQNRGNYNDIRVIKEIVYHHNDDTNEMTRETTIQTHYKFGELLKRNLPITHVYETIGCKKIFDSKKEVIITILNALLPCISIII